MDTAIDIPATLARAGMDNYQFNTGVVRNTDDRAGDYRVMVASAHSVAFGDCVAIGWYVGPGWQIAHWSPARARLIAAHLLRHADALEQSNGTKPIDQARKESTP